MVDKMRLSIPTRIETERLYLRCYEPGDGPWFYAMSRRNRAHLSRYESENVILMVQDEAGAEATVRQLAAYWAARECFFLGAFDRATGEFVAQVYVGPVNWSLPEYELGYIADVDHQGRGFVTEAVRATLRFVFEPLQAHRVRLECSDTNTRSYRLAERCGLVREGHVRENRREPDGTFSGTLFYGMLKGEFEALYGKKPESPAACGGGERPCERSSRHRVSRAGFFLGSSPANGCGTSLAEPGLAPRNPTACGGELHS